MSQEEVARLLAATSCLKHRAALSVAYAKASGSLKSPHSRSAISTASACLATFFLALRGILELGHAAPTGRLRHGSLLRKLDDA